MNTVTRMSLLLCLACWGLAGPAYALSPILQEVEQAFIRLGEEVRPSVVNIEVRGRVTLVPGGPRDVDVYEDLFKFFGIPPEGRSRRFQRPPAQGSGLVYDPQGHIITSNHVVKEAGEITVRLWDGDKYKAEIVGADPDTDLAVIKIDADRDLPVAKLGDSDLLRVGQFAIAMGSPQGLEGTLSFGHISALGRESFQLRQTKGLRFQNLIQTDAAINLGNSGGPLCNIDGEVIGINVAIISGYGAESLGFAIPINTVKKTVPTLIAEGKVTRGFLGVFIDNASDYQDEIGLPDGNGAFVQNVLEDTPAERAGLKPYDAIRKVDDNIVKDASDLMTKISDYAPGTEVTLEVWRDGKLLKIDVSLSEDQGDTVVASLEENVLGMRVQALTRDMAKAMGLGSGTQGVVVKDVEPGSPADETGIRHGDVILEIAKREVTDVREFRRLIQEYGKPGSSVLVRIARGAELPFIRKIEIPADTLEGS